MRKVAWLNEHLLYWNGGIHYIYETSSRLGCVDVIVTKASEDNVDKFQSVGTKVIQMSSIAANNIWYWILYPLFLCVNAYKLRKLLRNYQVVISTSPTANIWCLMIGVRPIAMVFEVNPWLYNEQYLRGLRLVKRAIVKIAGSFMKIWDKKAHRNAERLFCWSDAVRKDIVQIYGDDLRVEVNYGGVDSSVFQKRCSHKNILLHVASYLSPIKGTEYVIRSLDFLQGEILIIINSHKDLKERKRLLSLTDKVTSVIFVDQVDDLSIWYSQAMVLVQPNLDENVHYPVIEAAYCECPTISFRGENPSEDIVDGETGILTPVGDVKKLAEAVRFLFANGVKRDLMGLKAKTFVTERFSWDKHIRQYRRVIDELCDGKD